MWLRDTFPYRMTGENGRPFARVMIHGYDSGLSGSKSFQNLNDLGRSFYDSIMVLANSQTVRPIIIVAHSLGGLIVKQASPPR